jgi:hypothetical protein
MSAGVFVELRSPLVVSSATLAVAINQAVTDLLNSVVASQLNLIFWQNDPKSPLESVSFAPGPSLSYWEPVNLVGNSLYCSYPDEPDRPLSVYCQIPRSRDLAFVVTIAAMVAVARLSGNDKIEEDSNQLSLGLGPIKIADLLHVSNGPRLPQADACARLAAGLPISDSSAPN